MANLNILEQNLQDPSEAAVQSDPLPSVHLGRDEILLRSGIFSRLAPASVSDSPSAAGRDARCPAVIALTFAALIHGP